MVLPVLPDPAMHSVYLWDPGDLARRYLPGVLPPALVHYVGPPAAYLRWGTRPGFLVPARIAYLAFGVLPGFLVTRYLFALVAVVPAYVLGKRLHGAPVGALAVVLVLSSPVVVTAWGTDFPDSAAVSYLLGGIACLAMPAAGRSARRWWALAAAALLSLAVWSLASTAVLVVVAVTVSAAVTTRHDGRRAAAGRLALLAAGAVVTTTVLAAGSWVVLGRFDFVVPSVQAVLFLATPAQAALWHSTNWRWAPNDAYLLVLPSVAAAWCVLAARRGAAPAAWTVGLTGAAQLVVAAAGQFAGHLQLLEEHYISSPLWAASTLGLALVLAELTRPLATLRTLRWAPAALVVGVALVSEAAPAVPAFGWLPWGALLAAAVVAAAVLAPRLRLRAPAGVAIAARSLGLATTVVASVLVLTVAPSPAQAQLPGTVFDPPTGYDHALGGSSTVAIEDYRLEAEVRRLVPNATYRGEQLVTCLAASSPPGTNQSGTGSGGTGRFGMQLIGLFHTSINALPSSCPDISAAAIAEIRARNVAQLVAMDPTGSHPTGFRPLDVGELLSRLAPLHPRLARFADLRSGSQMVQVAVVDFPAAAGPDHRP